MGMIMEGPATGPVKDNQLTGVYKSMEQLISDLTSIDEKIYKLANKIVGAEPPAGAAPEEKKSEEQSFFNQHKIKMEHIFNLVRIIRGNVDRITKEF